MPTNIKNADMIGMLKALFIGKHDPALAWSRAASAMLLLPGLRGFWGLGSRDESGNVYDHSGQGRTLTNNSATAFGVYNKLIPYVVGDGSADYLSRADEAGLDITGDLTWGCWLRSNNAPAATERVIGKVNTTGNQRAYSLQFPAASTFRGTVSSNGTATTNVTSTVTYAADVWFHVVVRYTPSTELAIFVNGTKTVNTTSIPASIHNSTAPFTIGADGAGAELFDGDVALPFVCAAALDDTLALSLWHTQRSIFSR